MRIVDANVILRYLLDDHMELSAKARSIIDENVVTVPIEVLCEVVYVLSGVYKVERQTISSELCGFLENTSCIAPNRNVVIKALRLFAKNNLDFVDCVLAGYSLVEGVTIDTFDKKLQRLLQQKDD